MKVDILHSQSGHFEHQSGPFEHQSGLFELKVDFLIR